MVDKILDLWAGINLEKIERIVLLMQEKPMIRKIKISYPFWRLGGKVRIRIMKEKISGPPTIIPNEFDPTLDIY